MKRQILLFAFTVISTMLFSQAPVPMAFEEWKTTLGTQYFFYKNVTKTDAYGNIYVAGATYNSAGNTDVLIAKYNSAGVQLWIQQYAGAGNGHDFAAGMVVTDTYVIITGAVTTSTASPTTDVITMKYSSAGVFQWATTYNGAGNNFDSGKHVVLDGSGNVYITGGSYNASGDIDFVTIKYDASGTQQWVSTYDYTSHLDDSAIKVVIRGSNLVVTGAVTSAANSYKYATLTYAQSNGSLTASNVSTVTTTSSVTAVTDLTSDGVGNIYVVGSSFVSGQGYNYYVQKLSNTLVSAWTYTYNGASNLDDVTRAVQVDASGNVYISGYSTSSTQGRDIVTMKLNSSGVLQWTQTINGASNGDDEAADMILDASSNLYLTGYQTVSANNTDFYTIKYNSSGTKIWDIFTDGISLDDQATNITLDSLNNVIVTGQRSTSPNTYNFMTAKYIQQDVTNPVDLLNQPSNPNFGYHQNRGQLRNDTNGAASSALYYTYNQYPKIFIEQNAYDYVFAKTDTIISVNDTLERIQVAFSGANASAKPYGYNPKTYPLNYFLGHVGEPITNVRGNDRIVTQNLYPNIDLHYYSNSKGLKYYFVVREGADTKKINLNITGAKSTTITSNNLFIDGEIDDVTLQRPYAYMVNGAGVTTTLSAASWYAVGSNTYGITVPTYTTSQTLVIVVETVPTSVTSNLDPQLDYSTYVGRTDNDVFNDIRVASNGDRYVVGNTDGGTFPVFKGFFPYSGARDAVVLQYSVIKDSLVFASFYGGGGDEQGNSIDINSLGEIFIAGKTNGAGPGGIPTYSVSGASNQTSNGSSFNPSGADPNDGFIARFAPNGGVLTWARYYGGSQEDWINSIYIDNSDNLYFTGIARSNNIPMVSAAQPSLSSGTASTNYDAILGKFSSTLSQVFSTYLGGGSSLFLATRDEGRDITVDGSGNAIVVGTTDASNFPCSNSTGNSNTFFDNTLGGGRDGFIARYSPTGTKQFASYFGGANTYGIDEITRVNYNAVKDEIYIAGQSNDTVSFPYVNLPGSFFLKRKATNAAFIASMTGNLTKQWCTNYGKAASNFSVTGLASDNAGIIYMTGQAKSSTLNYPSTTPTLTVYQDTVRSADDGFVAIFNPQKDLFHAHYLGGTGNDYINNAYVGTNNKLYVVGNTGSTDYPIGYNNTNIAFIDSTFGNGLGQNDGFITRFDMSTIQIISVKETSKDDYLLSVYPNPSTNGFLLEMKDDELKNVQAKVYNMTGQLIVEQKITQTLTKFYCESWANGVYLINVTANGKLKTFKLIKN
ncbi:MAG: SBBP repeat-containing protein [Bacteroidia bacterium]|nr:SBBP repeat-containing protein [Bacteroidia bacterium]